MTTPKEPVGLDRRQLLKRSAIAGGTMLWVAPTVLTLTAWPAFTSHAPHGDGSPLGASYYLLSIKCGHDYYLVKIEHDDNKAKPFLVTSGPQVKGNNNDPNDGVPSNNKGPKDVTGITKKHHWASKEAGLPEDVSFHTVAGALYVVLNTNHDATSCTIDDWIVHKGRFYDHQRLGTQYGPTLADPDFNIFMFQVPPNSL